MTDFGQTVRKLRQGKKLTQEELAGELGVSLRTIKNYELGDTFPKKWSTVEKIADFFHVSTGELFVEPPAGRDEVIKDLSPAGRAVYDSAWNFFQDEEVLGRDKDQMIRLLWDLYWEGKESL